MPCLTVTSVWFVPFGSSSRAITFTTFDGDLAAVRRPGGTAHDAQCRRYSDLPAGSVPRSSPICPREGRFDVNSDLRADPVTSAGPLVRCRPTSLRVSPVPFAFTRSVWRVLISSAVRRTRTSFRPATRSGRTRSCRCRRSSSMQRAHRTGRVAAIRVHDHDVRVARTVGGTRSSSRPATTWGTGRLTESHLSGCRRAPSSWKPVRPRPPSIAIFPIETREGGVGRRSEDGGHHDGRQQRASPGPQHPSPQAWTSAGTHMPTVSASGRTFVVHRRRDDGAIACLPLPE